MLGVTDFLLCKLRPYLSPILEHPAPGDQVVRRLLEPRSQDHELTLWNPLRSPLANRLTANTTRPGNFSVTPQNINDPTGLQ